MLWRGNRESDNVEDARGSGGGGGLAVGGGLGALVIGLIAMLLGRNPGEVLSNINGNSNNQTYQQAPAAQNNGQEDEGKAFVRTVLASTEDVWKAQFSAMGRNYIEPKLKLFTDYTNSGCGQADKQVGPFYCPVDSKVYLDLSFFNELKDRFNAGGDFANAYVIAHEIGHHVQNLLGTSDKVHNLQERSSQAVANKYSVALELQADFYAGVWAHHSQKLKNMIESGDIESAMNTAAAIGDDKLQMQSQGYVRPDAFTHGTSAQRVAWFKKGYETGDIRQGDTFGGAL